MFPSFSVEPGRELKCFQDHLTLRPGWRNTHWWPALWQAPALGHLCFALTVRAAPRKSQGWFHLHVISFTPSHSPLSSCWKSFHSVICFLVSYFQVIAVLVTDMPRNLDSSKFLCVQNICWLVLKCPLYNEFITYNGHFRKNSFLHFFVRIWGKRLFAIWKSKLLPPKKNALNTCQSGLYPCCQFSLFILQPFVITCIAIPEVITTHHPLCITVPVTNKVGATRRSLYTKRERAYRSDKEKCLKQKTKLGKETKEEMAWLVWQDNIFLQ